jgi:hypothetical protein
MSGSTEAEEVARVRQIAAISYRDCDEAVAIRAFLETGNTEEVVRAFEPKERYVPDLLRRAMFQRLVMSIMRMHDRPDSDRESLPRAFNLLANPAVFETLASRGDGVRLQCAFEGWRQLARDDVLDKVRAVRDYESAHNIPSKANAPRPSINEFFQITDRTIAVVGDLASGTGVNMVALRHAHEIWVERCKKYWDRLIG